MPEVPEVDRRQRTGQTPRKVYARPRPGETPDEFADRFYQLILQTVEQESDAD